MFGNGPLAVGNGISSWVYGINREKYGKSRMNNVVWSTLDMVEDSKLFLIALLGGLGSLALCIWAEILSPLGIAALPWELTSIPELSTQETIIIGIIIALIPLAIFIVKTQTWLKYLTILLLLLAVGGYISIYRSFKSEQVFPSFVYSYVNAANEKSGEAAAEE
jgi:hypothetical protein